MLEMTVEVLDPSGVAVVSNTGAVQKTGDFQAIWTATLNDFRTQFPGQSLLAGAGSPGYTISIR